MRGHGYEGSWEEFEEQHKLNTASKWVLQSGVGVILLVFTIRWLIGRARSNVSSNSRLPSSTSSADLHQPPAPTRRPPSLNNKLRHVVARRATLGQWDLRTNWGMMSLWLVWFTYNAYMTFVYTNPKQRAGVAHMPSAFWRYTANRAGNLCFANLPFLFILVSRSSLICRLTGVPQQDLTWFHRWVGWGVVALGSIHVAFYTVWYFAMGNIWSKWADGLLHKLWFQAGFAAIFGFLLLAATSCRYMREHHHQLFISLHVGCSFLCLAACYLHWSPFGGWPAAAFFIFTSSRFVRLATIAWNGILSPFRRYRRDGTTVGLSLKQAVTGQNTKGAFLPASIDRLDERCLRVTVEFPGSWKAGDWAKLSFGDKSLGIGQWHPFSISNTPGPLPNPHGTPPWKYRSNMPATSDNGDNGSISSNESTYLLSSSTPVNNMVFVIAAHEGLTKKLHQAAPCKASVLVEGPYSVPHEMDHVDTLILVAGGTGIALIQAIWESVIKNPGSSHRPRRLIIVWTVKKLGNLDWIPLHQLHDSTPQNILSPNDLHLHYTHKPTPEEASLALESQQHPNTHLGRPIWDSILRAADDDSRGTTFVLACGPSGLTNQVTDAVLDIAKCGSDIRVAVELT